MKLNGLANMATRLQHLGGEAQQDRMIAQKRKTLDKAVLYSYQGAKVQEINQGIINRALINPNRLKQDYDDKIISIGFESGFKIGTVFSWLNTNTTWIIYLQDLTELAYFKGDIRKCSHIISWENDDGSKESSYVALIGPQEKGLDSISKENISIDIPNYTLQLLVPKTTNTLKYFNRYSKFYLNQLADNNPAKKICWRVEAVDAISSPGIIEVYANEYYANEHEDDIENGIVGGLIVTPIIPDQEAELIKGESLIKPTIEYTYTYTGEKEAEWNIISENPVEFKIDNKTIKIIWTKTYGGSFILQYGTEEKTIIIDSLF